MVCKEGGEPYMKKGHWSPDEDERLYRWITNCGVGTWSSVAELAGLQRSGKSCRLRWMNYLRPDLSKQPISKQEEDLIVSLQKVMGNRWSAIAARMPGRTDNEIKNYWNARIRKKIRKTAAKAHISTEICQNEHNKNFTSQAHPHLPTFACQPSSHSDPNCAEQNKAEESEQLTQNTPIHESNKFNLDDEYVNFLMSLPDVVPDIYTWN